jgi:ribosomal protein S6--L-glutamate ligase
MADMAIIAPKVKSKSTLMIIEEAKKLFEKVDLIPLERVVLSVPQRFKVTYKDKSILDYDYILLRIDSKRARFGYQLTKALDFHNIKKQYPASTVLIAHNKFATVFELAKAGLPIPPSSYTNSKESAEEIIEKVDFPIVIKLVSSFGGQGVMFAESETTAKSIVNTLDLLKQDIMLEKYVENPGEDIRAFIVGDEIAASMKRVAKKGEKRANIKAGGTAVPVELTEAEKDISLKAAKAVKSKILAVDMLRGPDGSKIIEVNINPGLQGITSATGINVAQKIAKFCYNEAKK